MRRGVLCSCCLPLDRLARSLGTCDVGRRVLKNTFANNAFENFEIAAYKSLLALCGAAGASEARGLLEQSLQEEERMAEWVDANVEKVTLQFVQHEERQAA